MKTFIGTKIVKAIPMTRAAYNGYRNWDLPKNENGLDEGYLVEYTDGGKPNMETHEGYVSWSPKEQFDNAYREFSGLTFGMAIEAMKAGKKVARVGWNGKGMWVCRGEGRVTSADSLWNPHTHAFAISNGGSVVVQPYLIMKNAQNEIQMGWNPTQSDTLAEDWAVIV